MSTIHMQIESAQETVQGLQTGSTTLYSNLQTLRQSIQSLTSAWEGGNREAFIAQADDTCRQLNQQADSLNILIQHLEREVQEWQETDQRGASQFAGISRSGLGSMMSMGSGSALSLTGGGGWSDSAGVFSVGMLSLPTAISIGSFTQGLPDWLRNFLDRFFPQGEVPSNVLPKRPAPATPSVTFGDVIKEENSSKYEEFYDVPALPQEDRYGYAACGMTSISMITDYYHNKDSSHTFAITESLISTLDPGDGTKGHGVSMDLMTNNVQRLGYQVPYPAQMSNMDTLKAQLKDGPVIVTVGANLVGHGMLATSNLPRANLGPGSTIHAMVVKGLTKDEQKVIMNDPWTGSEVTFSMDTFKTMWKLSGDVLMVIRP